jgi:Cof subfamily protein (haloacid dehalogenase superfamily)
MQNGVTDNQYRLVVFDLDGTLVDDNLEIAAEDLRGIEEARAKGLNITLATGRTFQSALPYIEKLGVDLPVILCNGAAIVSPKGGAILYQQNLHLEAANLLLEKAFESDLDCLLFTDPFTACPSVYRLTPLLADFILLEGLHNVELNNLIDIVRRDAPIKVQIVGDGQVLRAFQDKISGRVPELTIVMTQSDYLEAMPAGVSKGAALEKLAEHLQVPMAQIVAFGDSVNDREMLVVAGMGIAMAGAPEELKEAADFTVPSVAVGLRGLEQGWSRLRSDGNSSKELDIL